MNDEQLVQQFKNGDTKAFDELVNRYQAKVLNSCFRYLRDEEAARDATQDIFIKVYLALPRYKPKARFSTWLYKIVVNHTLNVLRKRKKGQRTNSMEVLKGCEENNSIAETGDTIICTDQQIEADERRIIVREALGQLNASQRMAIILQQYDGLSYKEIAQVMGTTVSAVESRLFRAKKKLFRILKEYF